MNKMTNETRLLNFKDILYSSFIHKCTFYNDSTDYQYHWYKTVSQNLNYKTYIGSLSDYLKQ